MNVAIFGVHPAAQIVATIIENVYNSWLKERGGETLNVVAFVISRNQSTDSVKVENFAILDEIQFSALYNKKVIDKIIFTREYMLQGWLINLMALGVKAEDIYLTCSLSDHMTSVNFLSPYLSAKFLPYLEFHIADHCNLNCRGCAHFSGLVTKPTFPVFEKFVDDINKLHYFIDDISQIRIMGGEPLLNPEVGKYVELCRKIYPKAFLKLVTNAFLLTKMSDNFFDTIRSNNASIDISIYPPLQSKLPQIIKLLEDKKVVFNLVGFMDNFIIKHTLKKTDYPTKNFFKCSRTNCTFLYDGKIAACCFPFLVKYFNEYYDKNLPQDGTIDLYEEGLNTEKIKRRLMTPFELCSHCKYDAKIDWGVISHPSPITDWTNDHLIDNAI